VSADLASVGGFSADANDVTAKAQETCEKHKRNEIASKAVRRSSFPVFEFQQHKKNPLYLTYLSFRDPMMA